MKNSKPVLPFDNARLISRTIRLRKAFNGTFDVKIEQLSIHEHLRVLGLTVKKLTPAFVRCIYVLIIRSRAIAERSGVGFLVFYLKACYTITIKAYSGYPVKDTRSYKCAVSLTKRGLPRIIPSLYRRRIMEGDVMALRFILTFFSVYRILDCPYKPSLSTITDPYGGIQSIFSELKSFITPFFWMRKLALSDLKVEYFTSLSSSASSKLKAATQVATSFYSLVRSALGYSKEPESLLALREFVSGLIAPEYFRFFDALISKPHLYMGPSQLGRLAFKEEPAGKVRVFAMVTPWLNWALAPLHKGIFRYLSHIRQDGTFNQLEPIRRLIDKGLTRFWSFDLSAATDRLPIKLQGLLLSFLLGEKMGNAWIRLMIHHAYTVPIWKPFVLPDKVTYSVGQPMGAMSSWAMLALTHHFIVQYAAWKVRRSLVKRSYTIAIIDGKMHFGLNWFKDYAILGDDVVIANGAVAREYLRIMKSLDVKISLAKTLRSRKGDLEFAKRIFVNGTDLKVIPYKAYMASLSNLSSAGEFYKNYSLKFSQLLRSRGYGYRSLALLSQPITKWTKSIRGLYIWVSYSKDILPWFRLGIKKKDTNLEQGLKVYFERVSLKLDSLVSKMKASIDAQFSLAFPKYPHSQSPGFVKEIIALWSKDPSLFDPELDLTNFNQVGPLESDSSVREVLETVDPSIRAYYSRMIFSRQFSDVNLSWFESYNRVLDFKESYDKAHSMVILNDLESLNLWFNETNALIENISGLTVPYVGQTARYGDKPIRARWRLRTWQLVNEALRMKKKQLRNPLRGCTYNQSTTKDLGFWEGTLIEIGLTTFRCWSLLLANVIKELVSQYSVVLLLLIELWVLWVLGPF